MENQEYYINMSVVHRQSDKNFHDMRIPHRSANVVLLLCKKGYLDLSMNLREYHMEPQQLLFVSPYCLRQTNACSDDAEFHIISFQLDFIKDMALKDIFIPLYEQIENSPLLSLTSDQYTMFEAAFDYIHKIHQRAGTKYPEIIKHQLISLMYAVRYTFQQRSVERSVNECSRKKELYLKFLSLVRSHYKTEHQMAFYADRLCVSIKYLMSIIKNMSGRNATQFINNAIIMDAKIQLNTTSKSIQEIAIDLNFVNPSFFGKFFKRITGVSPGEYRKGKVS